MAKYFSVVVASNTIASFNGSKENEAELTYAAAVKNHPTKLVKLVMHRSSELRVHYGNRLYLKHKG